MGYRIGKSGSVYRVRKGSAKGHRKTFRTKKAAKRAAKRR